MLELAASMLGSEMLPREKTISFGHVQDSGEIVRALATEGGGGADPLRP